MMWLWSQVDSADMAVLRPAILLLVQYSDLDLRDVERGVAVHDQLLVLICYIHPRWSNR